MPSQNYIDVLIRMINASRYEADAKRSAAATKRIGDAAEQTAKTSQKAATSIRNIGIAAGGFQTVRMMVGALASATNAASNFVEQGNKVAVVFGSSAGLVKSFADGAVAIGFAKDEALAAAGTFGGLFTGLGVAQAKAADMSISLTRLAADLASFNNVSTSDAFQALRAGLVGETEPLRRLNIQLSDQILRQRAMAMGLTTTTSKVLLPAQRTMAAYAEIMAQAGVQHGDFARTSTQLANSQRILNAEWRNAQIEIGQALIPAVRDLVHGLVFLLQALRPLLRNRTVVTVLLAEFTVATLALAVAVGVAALAFIGLDAAALPWIAAAAVIVAGIVLVVTHFDDLKSHLSLLLLIGFGPLGLVLAGTIYLFTRLGDIVDWALGKVVVGVAKLRGPIDFIAGKVGQISGIAGSIGGAIPGFAMGTLSAPGGLALVGERGPELVHLPRASRVEPLAPSSGRPGALMASGGGVEPSDVYLDDQKVGKIFWKRVEDHGARR